MSASTGDALVLVLGGRLLNSTRGGAVRRSRTSPSRISRNSLPLCSASSSPLRSSSRATGRPRSTISTDEPLLRPSINALSYF